MTPSLLFYGEVVELLPHILFPLPNTLRFAWVVFCFVY